MSRHFYSPLRYPGGKDKIYNFVSSLIAENDLIGIDYAEPYAGGAGLALHLLFNEFVGKIYINDIDKMIYSFWHTVLNNADDFCEWIENVEVNVDSWKYYKSLKSDGNVFEKAQSTFFLNRTNVSGVLKGGIIGGYDQKGKYKINARFNKEVLIQRILKISSMKDRIILSNKDGIDFVKGLNKRKKDFFIYLDPPYYEDGKDLYLNFYNDKDHVKLSKYVSKLIKYWMVSYDNENFILKLYDKYNTIKYKLNNGTSNGVGEEVIILSEKIKYDNSIQYLKLIENGDKDII